MDDLLTDGKIILALRAALIVVFGIDSAVAKSESVLVIEKAAKQKTTE